MFLRGGSRPFTNSDSTEAGQCEIKLYKLDYIWSLTLGGGLFFSSFSDVVYSAVNL